MENLNKIETVALTTANYFLREKVLNLEKENEELRKMVYELDEVLRKQQNVASALEFVKSYAVMHPNGPDRHDGRKFFSTVIVDYKPPVFCPAVPGNEEPPSKRVPEIKRWQVFIREV